MVAGDSARDQPVHGVQPIWRPASPGMMPKAAMNNSTRFADSLDFLPALLQRYSGSNEHRILLSAVVDILPKAMGADRCSIFIHDPSHQRAWLQCGTGLEEKELDIPLRGSITGEVIQSGRSIFVPDMRLRPGIHTDVDTMTGYDTRSVLCVPITDSRGNTVRGTLQLINKLNGERFDDLDRQHLEQVAVSLRKAIRAIYYAQFKGARRFIRERHGRSLFGRIVKYIRRFFTGDP